MARVRGSLARRHSFGKRIVPRGHRHGISLIEVLISMGILAFGLLGVAALFPVGHAYVLKATRYDRAAALGQVAFNEIKTHGLLAPHDATVPLPTGSDDPWVLLPGGGQVSGVLPPFQFDPLASRSMLLPAVMKWVTLKTLTKTPPTGNNLAADLAGPVRAAMERIFVSRDDLVVDLPDDRDQPSVQLLKYASDGKTAIERQYQGDFSWMFTVVPADNVAENDLYLVSVVVFYKRNTGQDEQGRNAERTIPAIEIEGGFGGGELTLPTVQVANVRPNDWLMVSSQPPGQPVFFRWYRVISVAELDATNTSALSIVGSDWPNAMNTSSGSGTVVNISLFDTAIAVYEKTMRADGLSMYSIPQVP